MLTAEEIVTRIEAIAHADGHHVFISGRLRVDAEYVGDMGQVYYRVNGVGALRQQVIRAINAARLNPTRVVKM
ncbi:hypothetical protein P0D75_18365 [Paraburkholderia sediminicola]|uniref:hypothetical protein n=1 Tax=Paraburkholderia sediminicola TaxID=458836 RepID=UPI0038B6F425